MEIRRIVLCLALLAARSAGEAVAAPVASNATDGSIQLPLSVAAASALPIDVQTLIENLCDPTIHQQINNLAQCRLPVPVPDDGSGSHVLRATLLLRPVQAPLPSQWQATAMALPSDPVVSPCGPWDVSVSVNATDAQPVSPLTLTPATEDPGSGLFASVLEIRAHLLLANEITGETMDYPMVLGLDMAGPWRLASADESEDLPPESSNLLLFADGKDHCSPVTVLEAADDLWPFVAGDCSICITGRPLGNPFR